MKQAVVITTDIDRRGVFFGYLENHNAAQGIAVLSQARMAVYYSPTTKGVLGLAANGPDDKCRIGPAVSRLEVNGVTSVADASPEAVERWEAQPWG